MTRQKADDLLERYLYKVGECLPKAQRDDVKAELRSLLADALEERAIEAGKPVDEALAVEALLEFGKPEDVAMRYTPQDQYLIGPRMYPAFLYVVRIGLIVLAVFYGFWFLVSVAGWGKWSDIAAEKVIGGEVTSFVNMFVTRLVNTIVEFISTVILNLGVMVIVFAILDRATRGEKEKPWDPLKLPAVPVVEDPGRVSPGALVWKVYAIVVLFTVLNFFPEWFGLIIFTNETLHRIPLSAMGIHIPVMLMNLWWAGALALNMWLLRQGRWNREARWAEFGLGVFGAGIIYLILVGSGNAQMDPNVIAESGLEGSFKLIERARAGLPWFGRVFHWALTIILLVSVWESLVRLYRLLTRYRTAS